MSDHAQHAMASKVELRAARRWGIPEWIAAAWIGLVIAALAPVTMLLNGSFPVFTVVWLAVPLAALLTGKDASRIGVRTIPRGEYLRVSAIALGLQILVAAAVEPWSHAYGALVARAAEGEQLDTTFAWLVRYDGLPGWGGFLLYSGLVTIFAEELFFRGWLLQLLKPRMGMKWAVVLQAALFTLPQGLAALVLSPVQGVVFALVYSLLAIGIIGGWAAARTGSIWPSLTSAALLNLLLTLLAR